jgi:hypothetical protein
MSQLERIREQIKSGAYVAPKVNHAIKSTIPMDKDSDDEEELNIWEPSPSLDATINSMSYFAPESWDNLKKKEQKISYKNFMTYLDIEVAALIVQAEKESDNLFGN